jgi:DNA-binding FadR family transcriptional regulator
VLAAVTDDGGVSMRLRAGNTAPRTLDEHAPATASIQARDGHAAERAMIAHLEPGLATTGPIAKLAVSRAGVTQLAECQLPKLNVAGSNPVSRSTSHL